MYRDRAARAARSSRKEEKRRVRRALAADYDDYEAEPRVNMKENKRRQPMSIVEI